MLIESVKKPRSVETSEASGFLSRPIAVRGAGGYTNITHIRYMFDPEKIFYSMLANSGCILSFSGL